MSLLKRPSLPHRTPAKITVGQRRSFTRTLTDGDTALFIGATWDVNPFHTDDRFVAQTRFGKRIVPGLLTASLLTHIGGLWNFLATEMHFEFLGPVFVGDTVTAVAEVVEHNAKKGWVWLDCQVHNMENEAVLKARIKGYPGHFQTEQGEEMKDGD